MKTITIDGVQIPTEKLIAAGWKAPEEKKSIVWNPSKGEFYYFVDSCGNVLQTAWGNNSSDYDDISRSDFGNIHKSFEGAQRAADVTKAIVRVNRRIEELNDGWVADWKNRGQKKWFLEYNFDCRFFDLRARLASQFPNKLMWVATETIGQTIIKEMRDDLCTIFGVKKEEAE